MWIDTETLLTLCIHSIIPDISLLKLKVDKCSRQDNLFMNKVLLNPFLL